MKVNLAAEYVTLATWSCDQCVRELEVSVAPVVSRTLATDCSAHATSADTEAHVSAAKHRWTDARRCSRRRTLADAAETVLLTLMSLEACYDSSQSHVTLTANLSCLACCMTLEAQSVLHTKLGSSVAKLTTPCSYRWQSVFIDDINRHTTVKHDAQ